MCLFFPENPMCPVNLFNLYVSKLNKNYPFFWQRAKRGKIHYTDTIWYDRSRVGHGPLENFMSQLSIDAKLSKRYTNHSIRSTVMGILGEQFEGRHVIGLSGHKNEASIKLYACRIPESKKREMSAMLGENAQPAPGQNQQGKPKFKFQKIAPASVPKPPENDDNLQAPNLQENAAQNQIQYDLEPVQDEPTDDFLLKFLQQFDPVTENPPQPVPLQDPPQVLQPLPSVSGNNLMNISNIQNVQNVAQPNQKQNVVPHMFFGGNSNVTINYNFGPQQ